jgi:hypothetical protein
MPKRIPAQVQIRCAQWLLVPALLLLCACGGSSFEFEGSWRGDRAIEAQPGQDPAIAKTLGRISLTITPDGRFEMFEGGVPKGGSFWVENGTGKLKVETYFDRPIEEAGKEVLLRNAVIDLVPQKDGSLQFVDPEGFDKTHPILKRETKPTN